MADGLVLPKTPEVRSKIQADGEGVTYLQVALDVLARLENVLDAAAYGDEIRFVRDCLEVGHAQTQLPCLQDEEDETGGKGDQPKADDPEDDAKARKRNARMSVKMVFSPATEAKQRPSKINQNGAVSKVKRKDYQFRGGMSAGLQFRGGVNQGGDKLMEPVLGNGVPWLGAPVPAFPFKNVRLDSPVASYMEEHMDSWNFDMEKFNKLSGGQPLSIVSWEVLRRSGSFSEFNIEPSKCARFVQAVEGKYATDRTTPYHNNLHAADVTQTMWSMLTALQLQKYYDPLDTTASLLSAIVHDIGHDGRSNAYHVAKQDELAVTYNDRSVLENFHVSTAFRLLFSNVSTNILHGLPAEQYTLFRKEIIDMVLSTDMALHFAKTGDFAQHASKNGMSVDRWHEDENSMFALRSMVLHTADISNQAKNQQIAYSWALRVLQEFFLQGDLEKAAGLPISPLCDRATLDISGSQVGFIGFIVKPSFEMLAPVCSEVTLCLQQLNWNKQEWQDNKMTSKDLELLASRRAHDLGVGELIPMNLPMSPLYSRQDGSRPDATDAEIAEEIKNRAPPPPRSHMPAFLHKSAISAPPLLGFSRKGWLA